jgi:hypothetical protein
MNAWEEYLDAARRLDTARQQAAGGRAAEAASAEEVRREIDLLHQRIGIQRNRLLDISRRAGLPDPQFVGPAPFALQDGPAPPAAQHAAVRAAKDRLDLADVLMSEVDGPTLAGGPLGGWSPPRRNALVYGAVAFVVLILQVVVFFVTKSVVASVVGVACDAVLPFIGFGLAWVGIGLLFHNGQRVERTPALGAVISAVPLFLLCTGWVATLIVR